MTQQIWTERTNAALIGSKMWDRDALSSESASRVIIAVKDLNKARVKKYGSSTAYYGESRRVERFVEVSF